MYWPDPVAFHLGPLAIHWYGLSYLVSFSLICYLIHHSNERKQMLSDDDLASFSNQVMLAIILGGRLGYVMFYQPNWILSDPVKIIQIWKGGMSFHGALMGGLLMTHLFCRLKCISTFKMMDLVSLYIPIGLFFGRIANFINQELPGRVTDVAWGVVFPKVDTFSRHPSQLYEAFFEGFMLFILVRVYSSYFQIYTGARSFFCLVMYATFRFFIEYFRQPDPQLGLLIMNFSMGQILSLVMLFMGLVGFMMTQWYSKNDQNKLA